MDTRKNMFAIVIMGFAIISLAGSVRAQDTKDVKKEPVVSSSAKSVTGKVTAVGKDYIAVAYQQDLEQGVEYEIFLPVDKNVRMEHARRITDIKVGDTVELSYSEETKTYSDGKADKNRKATKVSFISPAKKSPGSDEPEEGLNLKGFRGE